MKKMVFAGIVVAAVATNMMPSAPGADVFAQAGKSPAGSVPVFQVDSSWLKLPNDWVLGQVAAVTVDAQDNVWIIHRYRGVKPELKAAPPVLEFDSTGKFIRAWGGPGAGYEWPGSEHGLFVDHKGFVWIGGEGRGVNQVLKFSQDGKFVMQIGKSGQSKGLTDTENFVGPTDVFVWPKTNELFVGDTGGGGRVVVMDADTGRFKRMWGGFGNMPMDAATGAPAGRAGAPEDDVDNGADPRQLREAHRVRVSNDGIVYVADGPNKRFQVFSVDGKFVKQVYVERGKRPLTVVPIVTTTGSGFEAKWAEAYMAVAKEQLIDHHETSSGVALSTDPEQKYLYVYERSTSKIRIFDRKSLTPIGEFGDGPGRAPGQFYVLHDMRVDSRGNVYVAEVNVGSRVQKFVLKGYMTRLGTN
jgi:DNA-binding beta-propeller fold protein YncE